MPLDPSIILSGQGPRFGTLGDIMQSGTALTQARQARQMNDLALREKKRVLDEDAALRSAIQKHGGDYDAAAKDLDVAGFADSALNLRSKIADMRKKTADAISVELSNWGNKLNTIGQITNGIKDQDSFTRAKRVLKSFDPELADGMGDVYDPAIVEEVRSRGLSTKDYLNAKTDAVKATNEALRIELDAAKNKISANESAPKIAEAWTGAASKWFGSSHDQGDWDNAITFLTAQGAPKEIIAAFGPKWSADAVKEARDRGLTTEQREQLRLRGVEANTAAANAGMGGNQDVVAAVKAMKAGTAPPILPGRASKDYVALLAEAQRQGFDLATAATDWAATQKHFATLNGSQQTRIRQAVDTAFHSLDVIDKLADQWNGGRFAILNKANLAAAKNGAYGKEANKIATALEAQISDLTSELGNVYMGGNSPTDHALSLAGKNLSADWDKDVLKSMTEMARTNLNIRQNAIKNVGVIGVSADNPYDGYDETPPQVLSAGPGEHTFANGQTWLVSPDGKSAKRIR